MWWECSECGNRVEKSRRPIVCEECGIAGPVYVSLGTVANGATEAPTLAESWLRAGFDGAFLEPLLETA